MGIQCMTRCLARSCSVGKAGVKEKASSQAAKMKDYETEETYQDGACLLGRTGLSLINVILLKTFGCVWIVLAF